MITKSKRSLMTKVATIAGTLALALGMVLFAASPAFAANSRYHIQMEALHNGPDNKTSFLFAETDSPTYTFTKDDIVRGINEIGEDTDYWASLVDEGFSKQYNPTSSQIWDCILELEGTPHQDTEHEEFWVKAQDSYFIVKVESEGNGEASITNASDDDHYAPGSGVSLKATPEKGFAFDGWTYTAVEPFTDDSNVTHGIPGSVGEPKFDDEASETTTFTLPNDWLYQDLYDEYYKYTVKATFEPIRSYIVEFDKNASDATGEMQEQVLDYGVSEQLSTNQFKRDGYTFECWNTKADGSGTTYIDEESVSFEVTGLEETVTLYAQWKKIADDDKPADDDKSDDKDKDDKSDKDKDKDKDDSKTTTSTSKTNKTPAKNTNNTPAKRVVRQLPRMDDPTSYTGVMVLLVAGIVALAAGLKMKRS